MVYWQAPARLFTKVISPGFYSAQWAKLEGKTATDVLKGIKASLDKTYAETHYIWVGAPGRDSVRRPYMFQGFIPTLFIPTMIVWYCSRVFGRDPRTRKAAQITATAYGQGGQNVAAVPK